MVYQVDFLVTNSNRIETLMRAAMTRRTLTNATEAIDEIDSPVDGLEDGSLSITSQTTGNVTGNDIREQILIQNSLMSFSLQMFGVEQRQSQDAYCQKMDR